jgi:hypothetical protein
LRTLRTAVCSAVEEALAGTFWSAVGCPYVDRWFAYYGTRDARQVEGAVHRFAPETRTAVSSDEYVAAVVARIAPAVRRWRETGEVTGLPEGMIAEDPEADEPVDLGGTIARKALEGSGVAAADPAAVRTALGAGSPLPATVRTRMEGAFGGAFPNVRIHTGEYAARLATRLRARAFAVGEHVAFGAGEYRPGTPGGDALIAHELTHTRQQAGVNRSAGPGEDPLLEADADRASAGAVGALWGVEETGVGSVIRSHGLRLHRCDSCSKPAATTGRVPFSTVRTQFRAATTAAERDTILQAGVDSARAWRRDLMSLTGSGRGPIPRIRTRIQDETGVSLDANPFYGVNEDRVEHAYRAFGEGATTEPWILLALWVKEGRAQSHRDEFDASSPENAKILWRSAYYYYNMGLDHFTRTTPTSGDNVIGVDDAAAAAHESDFRARIAEQVAAGRLASDISTAITAELTATPDPAVPGRFTVSATPRFYRLSLLLSDAYFRENRAALAADPRIGADPDAGLTYMRWNMGQTRFAPFVPAAERHRTNPANALADGSTPTLTQWAFESTVRSTEWGTPRRNAIRFRYYVESYRLAYEGFPP